MSKLQRINPPSNLYAGPPTGHNTENGDNWATVIEKVNALIDHINGDEGDEARDTPAPQQYGAAVVRTGNEERDENGDVIDGTDVTKNVETDEDGNEVKVLNLAHANIPQRESVEALEEDQARWAAQGITHITENDGAQSVPVGEFVEQERKRLDEPVTESEKRIADENAARGEGETDIDKLSDEELEAATNPHGSEPARSEDRPGGKGANEPSPLPVGSGEATEASKDDPTEGNVQEANTNEAGQEKYPSAEDDRKIMESQPNVAPVANVEMKPPSADPREETDGNQPSAETLKRAEDTKNNTVKTTL